VATGTEVEVAAGHDGPSSRRRVVIARAALIFTVLVIVELVVVVVWAAWVLLGARQDLEQARADSVVGRAALADRNLDAAEASFAAAADGFGDGAAALRNPAVRLAGLLPVLRPNLATTDALAVSGEAVAVAARDVLAEVNGQGGLGAYLPVDGRVPVDRLAALADVAAQADRRLADAVTTVDAAPADGLLGPVADARAGFVEELAQARDLVGAAADTSRALVTFLGADGPKRYLIGAQNPAELRGTGGYIGAYSVAELDDGALSLDRFIPVQQLTSLPISEIPPPSQDFADRYNRFGGAGFWQAINATPDFPSAATAMVRLYERTEGTTLDGVIVVDPFALEALLALTGDVDVPEVGRVTADDVVRVVSNEAYTRIAGNAQRKEILGGIASVALRRLLRGASDADADRLIEVLAPLGRDRHLLLHSTDAQVQAAFGRLELAGALPRPRATGDTVAVVVNNAAVNKVDYYVDRRVEQRVQLRPDGSADVRLRVRFTNTAPASGPGTYVLGSQLPRLSAGDDLSLVSLFCGRCRVTGATPPLTPKGIRSGTTIERELGHTVASTLLTVPQGQRSSMTVTWRIADAWDPDGAACYRSTYVAQPTIRGTVLRVTVTPPAGWELVGEGPGGAGQVSGMTGVRTCYAA
jgi:hypothetical protein